MDRRDEGSWDLGDRGKPVGHRRFAAIEGRVCTKAMQSKTNDVLLRAPINYYFST